MCNIIDNSFPAGIAARSRALISDLIILWIYCTGVSVLRAAGTVNHLFTNLLGFLCFTWIRKFKVTETLNHLYQRTKSVWLPQNKPRGQSCRTQRKSPDVSHSISRRNTNRPEWVNSCHKIRFKCYKCNARAAQIIWCWWEIQIFDLWFFIKSEHTLRRVEMLRTFP